MLENLTEVERLSYLLNEILNGTWDGPLSEWFELLQDCSGVDLGTARRETIRRVIAAEIRLSEQQGMINYAAVGFCVDQLLLEGMDEDVIPHYLGSVVRSEGNVQHWDMDLCDCPLCNGMIARFVTPEMASVMHRVHMVAVDYARDLSDLLDKCETPEECEPHICRLCRKHGIRDMSDTEKSLFWEVLTTFMRRVQNVVNRVDRLYN